MGCTPIIPTIHASYDNACGERWFSKDSDHRPSALELSYTRWCLRTTPSINTRSAHREKARFIRSSSRSSCFIICTPYIYIYIFLGPNPPRLWSPPPMLPSVKGYGVRGAPDNGRQPTKRWKVRLVLLLHQQEVP